MIHTELHAAGISNERLRESYRYCRRLNAEHGRTYFLATRLLTPSQRPAVHALYPLPFWCQLWTCTLPPQRSCWPQKLG